MQPRKLPTGLEVLAVGIIVAVIAAILFPVFARSHDENPHVYCAFNEKQLGLALLQYAQDNDNSLPSGTQGSGIGWAGQIYSYVKCVGVYFCPDDPTPVAGAASVISYGFNANAARHPALNRYASPSHTVLLFEVSGVKADITHKGEGASHGATTLSAAGDGTEGALQAGRAHPMYATGRMGSRPPAPVTQVGEPRHGGGSNFLLADGHVKWLKPEQVSSGSNAVKAGDDQTGTVQGTAAGTGDAAHAATFSVK